MEETEWEKGRGKRLSRRNRVRGPRGREDERVPGAAGVGARGGEQPTEWRDVRGRGLEAAKAIRWQLRFEPRTEGKKALLSFKQGSDSAQ